MYVCMHVCMYAGVEQFGGITASTQQSGVITDLRVQQLTELNASEELAGNR